MDNSWSNAELLKKHATNLLTFEVNTVDVSVYTLVKLIEKERLCLYGKNCAFISMVYVNDIFSSANSSIPYTPL